MNEISYPTTWIRKIDEGTLFSINNGLSGAVISATIQGKTIFQKNYGYQKKYNERELMSTFEPMQLDTIFDLASLTKIFSTVLAFMKLVDERQVSVEHTVKRYLPDFCGGDKDEVSLQQLLGHNSGLPASYDFYNPERVHPDFFSQTREKTLSLLPKVPLAYKPNQSTVYSDIGFMLLGAILEKVTGMRQDRFVEKMIYAPLGLKNTMYIPLQKGFTPERFEASERCGNTRDGYITFPNIRTKTIQGEVQDELVYYSMAQIAAHAGLFSTAEDLQILCQLLLNKGSYKSFQWCSTHTVDTFLNTKNIDNSYSLGFHLPSGNTSLIYGVLLPEGGNAYGHTGWTGKCVLLDYEHQSSFLILTNKRHSPVINVNNKNFNHFEGNLLPASLYGHIIQLFYAGLIESSIKKP